jgi:uncharacterized protein (DUF1330 family)
MSIYIIAEFHIHTRSEYDKYDELFMDVFDNYNGKLLSVDEAPTVLEGEWASTRSVLIEFPSKTDAMVWMTCKEYIEIARHRLAGSTGRVRLVTGGVNRPSDS